MVGRAYYGRRSDGILRYYSGRGSAAGRPDLLSGDVCDGRRKPCGNLCRRRYDDPLRESDLIRLGGNELLAVSFLLLRKDSLGGRYDGSEVRKDRCRA